MSLEIPLDVAERISADSEQVLVVHVDTPFLLASRVLISVMISGVMISGAMALMTLVAISVIVSVEVDGAVAEEVRS